MNLSLSWRQIGLAAVAGAVAFLAGLGVGVAIVGGALPAEVVGALISLVLMIIAGAGAIGRVVVDRIIGELRPQIERNTDLTRLTLGAAEHAKDAAENVQAATVDRLDYDRLRRMEAAVLTLDECGACRDKILEVTDRRRLRPRTKEDADAT